MIDLRRAVALIVHDEASKNDRGWDYQGIWANVDRALGEDGRTPAQVVVAGLQAVHDKKAESPGAIRWGNRYTAAKGVHSMDTPPRCATCGKPEDLHELIERRLPPEYRHEFAARGVRQAHTPGGGTQVTRTPQLGDTITESDGTKREVTW